MNSGMKVSGQFRKLSEILTLVNFHLEGRSFLKREQSILDWGKRTILGCRVLSPSVFMEKSKC